ncbi:MAG TPA: hypothetical protein VGM37_15825 [Armatimonadota bacterium]|jgi:hypothetical protein
MKVRTLLAALAAAACLPATAPSAAPAWKRLPLAKPAGELQHTGSYTVEHPERQGWKKPKFVYNAQAATGRKEAKVIVLIYDPKLPSEGGKRLTEFVKANDPVEYSHILVDAVRQASWGYINYKIVDIIRVDGFPRKVDGFLYTPESFLEVRKTQNWQPSTSSYRGFFVDNNLLNRVKKENITELWVWGASGMHFDEFAMYIPNRYARYAPTDNEWFYRPYDIPPEIGHTMWVMGFNYEVGSDNMIHSYTHRVESMAALGPADGIWDTVNKRDPWNVFSWLEMDHKGTPSMVGNCHVPPNGESGYDYNNKRKVESWADNWANYPDLRGPARTIGSEEWCYNQHGYQRWILEHLPKYPGYTRYGYNNWWVYIANTDEDLPEYHQPDPSQFRLPSDFPAPGTK